MRLRIPSPVGMHSPAEHTVWLAHRQRLEASLGRRPHVQNALVRQGGGAGRVWLSGEITAASALKAVAEIEAAQPASLQIFVDSIGGDTGPAWEIASALQKFKGSTEAIILKAESAAVIPAMACQRVQIARDGSMLLHAGSLHPLGGVRLEDMDAVGVALRGEERRIANLLAARPKASPSTFWTYLMHRGNGAGTRLSAEDSLNYGLVDYISPWPMSHIRRGQWPASDDTAPTEPRRGAAGGRRDGGAGAGQRG